jgi:hypothetical protein
VGADTDGSGEAVNGGAPGQAGSGVDEATRIPDALTRADLWPLVNICGGVFMLELGNVMGSLAFELRRKRDDSVEENSAANFGYYFTTSASYVSWSAAVASVPVYISVFPDRAFRLSPRGRLFFTLGLALSIGGNVLDLLAGAQRYRADFLFQDYLSTGTDFDYYYDRYRRGYLVYTVERITSYAFWGLGGAGMITAFFLPGEREALISGFWDRTALVGGMTLVGLGSVTGALALYYRQSHVSGGGDEADYNRYVLTSVLSYGFWALGGTAMILPLFTDIGRGKVAVEEESKPLRPEQLMLVPAPGGAILRFSY